MQQALRLAEMCAKAFQPAARQLANIRLVRAKTARIKRRDRAKTGKAVYGGIDWSDREHGVCPVDAETGCRRLSVISLTPEAINEWARAEAAPAGDARRLPGTI